MKHAVGVNDPRGDQVGERASAAQRCGVMSAFPGVCTLGCTTARGTRRQELWDFCLCGMYVLTPVVGTGEMGDDLWIYRAPSIQLSHGWV